MGKLFNHHSLVKQTVSRKFAFFNQSIEEAPNQIPIDHF